MTKKIKHLENMVTCPNCGAKGDGIFAHYRIYEYGQEPRLDQPYDIDCQCFKCDTEWSTDDYEIEEAQS